MLDVIVTLHLYNMLLVMAAGLVSAVWGLVLYLRERRLGRATRATTRVPTSPSTSPAPTEASTGGDEEKTEGEKGVAEVSRRSLDRSWSIALIVTAIVAALQGVLGVTLLLMGQRPPGGSLYYLHYVYGGIVALAIPAAVSYATSGKNLRRDILIYTIAAFILAAAGARALMTGLGLP